MTPQELDSHSSQDKGTQHPPKEGRAAWPRTVGIVGLGHMGTAFALNLLADGYPVLAHDRNPASLEMVRLVGAHVVSDIGALAACDLVLTSLPDDEALKTVCLTGLLRTLHAGAVHVSTSTVSPGLSRLLATEHGKSGQGFVAAPVLGNPDLALARKLFVLAAGRTSDVDRVRPVLEPLCERLFIVGEDAGAANLLKLAGNVLTATTLQGMAEVLALLRKTGVDPHVAFDILTQSLFDSKVHRTYGGKIVNERYRPAGMVVPLAIKDLRLALAEAERASVPMPTASLVRDRLVGLVAGGWADLDWSALGLLEARDAGLAASALSSEHAASHA